MIVGKLPSQLPVNIKMPRIRPLKNKRELKTIPHTSRKNLVNAICFRIKISSFSIKRLSGKVVTRYFSDAGTSKYPASTVICPFPWLVIKLRRGTYEMFSPVVIRCIEKLTLGKASDSVPYRFHSQNRSRRIFIEYLPGFGISTVICVIVGSYLQCHPTNGDTSLIMQTTKQARPIADKASKKNAIYEYLLS
jgi:hypothetical protein